MRNIPATLGMTADSYNEIRKEASVAMNTKRILQILIVLTLLFNLIGTGEAVSANTVPQRRGIPQTGPSVSITILPPLISINATATATVSLKDVLADGYTSAEFNCTYRADLVQVLDI